LNNNAAGADAGDSADRRLDLADGLGRRGRHLLSGAANDTSITWRVAGAMKHGDPLLVGAPRGEALIVSSRFVRRRIISSISCRRTFFPIYSVTVECMSAKINS
jgi:hypothetical protein